jgi:HlyD family secretion protein
VLAVGVGVLFMMERPPTVTVVRPETDVALRIYGLGTVEAGVLTRVRFEVGATLLSLSVDAADTVAKGQTLGALHQGEQEARMAHARAAVAANLANQAKAEASVVRTLAVLTQRETANWPRPSATRYRRRRSTLPLSRRRRFWRITGWRPPFDAVIVARHAEAGAVARAGGPIFTLVDPATI